MTSSLQYYTEFSKFDVESHISKQFSILSKGFFIWRSIYQLDEISQKSEVTF